jgi:hypothetical protein
MTMEIEQESGISIFAAAGWVQQIEASDDTRKWAESKNLRGRFEKYREAWWWLQSRKAAKWLRACRDGP